MRITKADLDIQVGHLSRVTKKPHGLNRWQPGGEIKNELFTGKMKDGSSGIDYLSCDHVYTGLNYTTRELYYALLLTNDIIRHHDLRPAEGPE